MGWKAAADKLALLRQACDHPSVGARGLRNRKKKGRFEEEGRGRHMTNVEMQDKLLNDERVRAEDNQRAAMAYSLGIAGLHRLAGRLAVAFQTYREALKMSGENSEPVLARFVAF